MQAFAELQGQETDKSNPAVFGRPSIRAVSKEKAAHLDYLMQVAFGSILHQNVQHVPLCTP